jgi:SAM-dependent methyltransferase
MDFSPKVSIVIPVYNGSDFLREAIDSALAQTYRNAEILVVNDGSTDGGATERIAQAYGDKVRYFAKTNGGVASALNLAIRKMTGEYLSWLSHDDLYNATKVECEVATLSRLDRERTVIYSDYSVFSSDPEKAVPIRLKGVAPEQFRYWITVENALHGCTLLIPKAAFAECGNFNECLRTTQDYDLWFRLAEKYRFVHIPEVLVKARSHPEQGSIKMAGTALEECNALLSGFVKSLTGSELAVATQRAPSMAYAEIAASMWHRGFRQAGQSAARLAMQRLTQGSVPDRVGAVRIVMSWLLKYYTVRLARPFLGSRLRLRIKALLHRRGQHASAGEAAPHDMTLKQRFSEIYDQNIFGGRVSRSGEGSDLVQTAEIRRELPKLLQALDVKTFLDAPCGDWCWMRHTELGIERYIGIDIVEALIERNRREYSNDSTSFQCMNLAEGELPRADLIFSRDCLVHLSFEDAFRIIANFKRSGSKYLLTTTFVHRDRNNDLVGKDSFWRPLNMQLPPFNFPKPILLINEGCTEEGGQFTDKCLGLWQLEDIGQR